MKLRVTNPTNQVNARIAAVLATLATLVLACDRSPSATKSAASQPAYGPGASVTLIAAKEAHVERVVVASGDLRSDEDATLSVKVPGRLAELKVDLGDKVKKDDLVALIEPTDYALRVEQARSLLEQARAHLGLPLQDGSGEPENLDPDSTADVRAAKATLDEAERQLSRAKELLAKSISTQAEYDTTDAAKIVAENRYRAAREEFGNRIALVKQRHAELEIAEQQLKDTEIRAPFQGSVIERKAGRGDFLQTGAPVATLARVDPVRLAVMVPEREATKVAFGQTVRFVVEGGKETFTAKVSRISSVFDARNRALRVEADVPNPDWKLRAGAFVEASIVVEENSPAVMVPAASIRSFAGFDKVLVVADGKIAEKRVTLGQHRGDEIEVMAGLAAGDRIVAVPGSLDVGAHVTVAN